MKKNIKWIILGCLIGILITVVIGYIVLNNNDILIKQNDNSENELIGDEKKEFIYNEEEITDLVYEKDIFRAGAVTGVSGSNPVNIDATVVQPYINIKSDDVDKINTRLKELYDETVKSIHINNSEYWYDYFDYNFNIINDEILSFRIYKSFVVSEAGGFYGEYEIYNIDIETGKVLSNSELLERIGIKYDVIKNNMMKEVKNLATPNYEDEKEEYDNYYKEWIESESYSIDKIGIYLLDKDILQVWYNCEFWGYLWDDDVVRRIVINRDGTTGEDNYWLEENKNVINIKEKANEEKYIYTKEKKEIEDENYYYVVTELPYINIKSDDVDSINKELEESYNKSLNNLVYEKAISYTYSIYKEKVLSLIIYEGNNVIDIYNIDIATGKTLSNDKILEILGIKWEDVEEKINNTNTTKKDVKLFIGTNYIRDEEWKGDELIYKGSYHTNGLYINLKPDAERWTNWEYIDLDDK